MPTWVNNSKWDWKGNLQRDFVTLFVQRASALISRTSRQRGGTDVGDAILGHYLDAPLATPSFERWTRYRRVPDAPRANPRT